MNFLSVCLRHTFDFSNALLDLAMQDGVKPEQIDEAFDTLITYLANHFSHEEKILRTRNYEGLSEHSEKHQALLKEVRKLKNNVMKKGSRQESLSFFWHPRSWQAIC